MATELRVVEDYCSGAPVDFEEQYGALYRPTDAPLPYAGEWRDHFERCRSANDGHAAAGQRYDDGAAAAAKPPPLEAGDVVDVSKEDGSGVVEAAVQGGDARAVLVKPPGGPQEEIPRSSWRLGGGGPRSRRGAHVAEQQTALLVQPPATFPVICPHGAGPGSHLRVRAPNTGQEMTVIVPAGVGADAAS